MKYKITASMASLWLLGAIHKANRLVPYWYSVNVFEGAYISRLFELRHYAILIEFGQYSESKSQTMQPISIYFFVYYPEWRVSIGDVLACLKYFDTYQKTQFSVLDCRSSVTRSISNLQLRSFMAKNLADRSVQRWHDNSKLKTRFDNHLVIYC